MLGFLGWHLAYRFSYHPVWFALGVTFLMITTRAHRVGGIATQDLIQSDAALPAPVNVAARP